MSTCCSVSDRAFGAMSYKLQLQIRRSGFAGIMCRYCWALGHRAKPGLTSFVKVNHGSRALAVDRWGTGTDFDLSDWKLCVSPYLRYFETYVPLGFGGYLSIIRTTRPNSPLLTTGWSTVIKLCISGFRNSASIAWTLPSPAFTILRIPSATRSRSMPYSRLNSRWLANRSSVSCEISRGIKKASQPDLTPNRTVTSPPSGAN